MLKRSEGFFNGYRDIRLYFQTWAPTTPSKGLLVVTHGQGEHSDSYQRLIQALGSEGWTLLLWDLRGHGRSEGQRGYVASFHDYSRDFEMLVKTVVPDLSDKGPLVYFGHSMGALIQLNALAGMMDGNTQPQILSSPFLGLSMQVPAIKDMAAQALRHLLPRLTLGNEINHEDLSSDPLMIREYEKDTLRHHKISPAAYLGALECSSNLLSRPMIWKGKMLFLLAENDPVVSTQTNLQFVESLTHAEVACEVFENRKHELINDLGREEVFEKIRDFLRQF